jgi:predicted PurR-regulated permease PerM
MAVTTRRLSPGSAATMALLAIATVAALKLGAALFLPIALALFISQLLAPAVRGLCRARVPVAVSAGLVVFGFAAVVGAATYGLAAPAASWLARAPETFTEVERKIRRLVRPLQSLEQAAAKVERAAAGPTGRTPAPVEVAKPGLVKRLTGTTAAMVGGILSVIFLCYFLLANGPRFREKLADVIPRRGDRARVEEALQEIEVQLSRYLVLNAAVCVIVGLATWGWLTIIKMPNAPLWGVLAGVLNFVPYLGAVVTLAIIGLAALVSFDTLQQPLLAVGGFAVVNLLEGNLLTPTLMGRKLPLNAVALFIGFLFWSWVWGVAGAILAVPMTVLIKIVCDRIEAAKPFALFLDS